MISINGVTLNPQLVTALLGVIGAILTAIGTFIALMAFTLRDKYRETKKQADMIAKLVDKTNEQSSEIQAVKNEKTVIETSLALITQQRDRLDIEVQDYKEKLDSQKEQHRDELDRLYRRIGEIEAGFERRMDDQQTSHDAQINAQKEKHIELQNHHNDLQKRFTKLETEYETVLKERNTLQATTTSQSNTIANLRQDIRVLEDKIKQYEDFLLKAQEKIEQLIKTQGELQASFDRDLDSFKSRMDTAVSTLEQRIADATVKLDALESKSESKTVE